MESNKGFDYLHYKKLDNFSESSMKKEKSLQKSFKNLVLLKYLLLFDALFLIYLLAFYVSFIFMFFVLLETKVYVFFIFLTFFYLNPVLICLYACYVLLAFFFYTISFFVNSNVHPSAGFSFCF